MTPRVLAGQAFEHCEMCDGIWIKRAVVLEFSQRQVEEHPWLGSPASPVERDRQRRLHCPDCRLPLRVFDFRGGATCVDQCERCDRLFFDAGELPAVLKELQRGTVFGDDARRALVDHHLERAVATEATDYLWLAALVVGACGLLLDAADVLGDWGLDSLGLRVILAGLMGVGLFSLWWRREARRRARHARHLEEAQRLASRKAQRGLRTEGVGRSSDDVK
jgi:Zn-finger nucleic acid-binding protein